MATISRQPCLEREPEPTWDIARLFPYQGGWDEEDYLALDTNHLVEFTDGYVEVLPMPTTSHQLILQYLFDALRAFVTAEKLGTVFFAGIRVRFRPSKIREPDLIFMAREHVARIGERYWSGADLLMEVVSPDVGSHKRDYERKRRDYAEGGVQEYWIVDPQLQRITVLTLSGTQYRVRGEFVPGEQASSLLLGGFAVEVSAVF